MITLHKKNSDKLSITVQRRDADRQKKKREKETESGKSKATVNI